MSRQLLAIMQAPHGACNYSNPNRALLMWAGFSNCLRWTTVSSIIQLSRPVSQLIRLVEDR